MTPFGRDSFFTNQISGGSRQWSNFLAGGFCSTGSCSACVGGVGVDVDVRVDRCRFSKSHCRCMLIMTLMWIKYVPRPRSYLVRDIGYIYFACVCVCVTAAYAAAWVVLFPVDTIKSRCSGLSCFLIFVIYLIFNILLSSGHSPSFQLKSFRSRTQTSHSSTHPH